MMSKRTIAALFGFSMLATSAVLWAKAHDDHDADRASIKAHIESIFTAFVNKDHDTLAKTHAQEWVGFLGGSRAIMHGRDAYMKAADATIKGQGGMKTYKIDDIDIAFPSNDVAVVNYVATVDGEVSGKPFEIRYRTLDVYSRKPEGWIQVSTNTAIHPETTQKQQSSNRTPSPAFKEAIEKARDEIWTAWFAGDRAKLEKLLPDEAISINPGREDWANKAAIIQSSEQFAQSGAKLAKITFPKTEIQAYGSTVIVYSLYEYDIESRGKTQTARGHSTEIFVLRDGALINTGWQIDRLNPASN